MAHKAEIIRHDDLERPDTVPGQAWEQFDRHCLAEGDSWFTLAALPGGNLLQELHLKKRSLIVSCAYPGDTLSHMVDWRDNPPFVKLLAEKNFARKWDAVLLSAGGNDLIDAALAQPGILCRPTIVGARAEDYIDPTGWKRFARYLQAHFEAIAALRDRPGSPNKGIPLITHTYDYPTARNAPARALGVADVLGPWLYKAYTRLAIPEGVWIALTDLLMDRLAELVLGLKLRGLIVIDTRGTLQRAALNTTGEDGDWLNEIHTTWAGRKKLADKWAPVLDGLE